MTNRSTVSVKSGRDGGGLGKFTLGQAVNLNPLPIVAELPFLCSAGTRALDIGAGTGRNAIFLAKHGIHVDAIDRFASGIDEINQYAQTHALSIHAIAHDFREVDPDFRAYGLILCTLILHHLSPSRGASLLANARMHAKPGTFHVVAAITLDGDFSREFNPGERYFPDLNELRRMYSDDGWEVHRAYHEKCRMLQTHGDGRPMHNLVSFLIATRPFL